MLCCLWQVGSLPVYGVAIPTVDGIRRVLDLVGASKHGSSRHVLWHNLREEPVGHFFRGDAVFCFHGGKKFMDNPNRHVLIFSG